MQTLAATVYVTASTAVRKTADDCRRLLALLDALQVKHERVHIDTREMLEQVVLPLTNGAIKELPLLFVGDVLIGTFDQVSDMNEDGLVPQRLRAAGYTESVRGGEAIPIVAAPKVKKPKKGPRKGDGNASPSPAEDDSAPPPPPDDDGPPPLPDDDGPPPPPDDDGPPPPPDEDGPPPPPDDDGPPPPPADDAASRPTLDAPPAEESAPPPPAEESAPPPPAEESAPPPPAEESAPPPPPEDDQPPPPPE